jgi:hypothetical protein
MNYAKVFNDDDEEPIGKPSEDVDELNRENFRLKEELKECQEQGKQNEGDDPALYNKRRSDILYRYNKKNVAPTEKTMKKYDVKYDNVKKIYY